MSFGQRSDEIKTPQQMLSVSPTGYFGPLTRQAVINFQKKYGIDPIGTVGPITRAKLNQIFGNSDIENSLEIRNLKLEILVGPFAFGYQNDQVKLLQQYLSRDPSIYTGPVTGYYGPLTKAAVTRFQAKYGIEQTGVAGPQTRQKLNALYSQTLPSSSYGIPSSTTTSNEQLLRIQDQIKILQEKIDALRKGGI